MILRLILTVVEYFHTSSGHYFMTGSADDQHLLESAPARASFAPTGRSFAAWSASNTSRPAEAVAVARFFSPALASHVFTANAEDIKLLRSHPATASGSGFVDEGTAFFALAPVDSRCDAGTKAIFRAFNNRVDGNHRFSNELELHATMLNTGFSDDSVAFCSTGISTDDTKERAAGTPRPSTDELTVSGTVNAFVSLSNFKVGTQAVDASNARFDHGAPSALVNGLAVTVEGILVNGVIKAKEIKLPTTTPMDADEIKGFITAIGSSGTVFVNGTSVDISHATLTGGTQAHLLVGAQVEIHGAFSSGIFIATSVKIEATVPTPPSTTPPAVVEAEVSGAISNFLSISNFTVASQLVDASGAVIEDGTADSLINGATVEVHGLIVGGVLKATRLEVKRAVVTSPVTPPTGTPTPPHDAVEFEATGAVSAFISVASFKVSGAIIDATSASFEKGSVTDLKNGATVQVKGTLTAGVVKATRVRFEK